jgi:hypothetical protein
MFGTAGQMLHWLYWLYWFFRRKADPEKVERAWRWRQETTMALKWIAKRLKHACRSNTAPAHRRARDVPKPRQPAKKKRLQKSVISPKLPKDYATDPVWKTSSRSS